MTQNRAFLPSRLSSAMPGKKIRLGLGVLDSEVIVREVKFSRVRLLQKNRLLLQGKLQLGAQGFGPWRFDDVAECTQGESLFQGAFAGISAHENDT
jgi:hypothetical protein